MPDPTPEQVRAVASVVAEYIGGDDPSDPHSWRCYDKERYPGNCGCDRDLATYILAAVRTDPAVQDAMLAALVEGGALHCCCAWCCTGSPREQRGQGAGCPS